MSAPHTDLEKQKRRHKTPLLGLRAMVLWALVLLAIFTLVVVLRGNDPGDSDDTAKPGEGGAAIEQPSQ